MSLTAVLRCLPDLPSTGSRTSNMSVLDRLKALTSAEIMPQILFGIILDDFFFREQVWVKVIEVDENGKVSLSMKLVNQETGLTTCLNQ